MPKHLTSHNEYQKGKYKAHPAKIIPNKIKRLKRHLKKQPNDLQTKRVLEAL